MIIKVGKKKYWAGAFWQMSGSLKKEEVRKEAKQLVSTFDDGDEYTGIIITGDQFALVKSKNIKRECVPSLSCALVNSKKNGWLGKLCLSEEKDVWWVVAIAEGIVHPEGDELFNSEVEADKYIRSTVGSLKNNITEKITCETFEESLEFLQEMVVPSYKVSTLKHSSTVEYVKRGIWCLLAVLCCFYAFSIYQDKVDAERLSKEIVMQKEKMSQKKQLALDFPEKVFLTEWTNAPEPEAVYSLFKNLSGKTPIYNRAYKLEGLTLELGSKPAFTTYWGYLKGASFGYVPYGDTKGFEVDLSNPKQPAAKRQLHPLKKRSKKYDLLDAQETAKIFNQWADLTAGSLELSWEKPISETIGATGEFSGIKVESPYRRGKWKLQGVDNSSMLMALPKEVSSLTGLVIDSISYKNNEFVIEGTIYAIFY